jgi:hypothetical protein
MGWHWWFFGALLLVVSLRALFRSDLYRISFLICEVREQCQKECYGRAQELATRSANSAESP